jgi:hypothetical protein
MVGWDVVIPYPYSSLKLNDKLGIPIYSIMNDITYLVNHSN